jgi:rod shape-determining protein MreD
MKISVRQYSCIFVSFVGAWFFMIFPIPHDYQYFRPVFLSLILIYWIFALPQSIGILTAWTVGLVMDILGNGVIGQYALAMVMVAFFARFLRYRIRLKPFWQQAVAVSGLVGIGELTRLLIQWLFGHPPHTLLYWIPTLLSIVLWPWICRLLRFYERKAFG